MQWVKTRLRVVGCTDLHFWKRWPERYCPLTIHMLRVRHLVLFLHWCPVRETETWLLQKGRKGYSKRQLSAKAKMQTMKLLTFSLRQHWFQSNVRRPQRTVSEVEVELLNSIRLFATPWTVAHQAPLSMGFSRQEYWSGLPFPSPGDLPNPGIEPGSPILQADALPSELPGKPLLFQRSNSSGLGEEFVCAHKHW